MTDNRKTVGRPKAEKPQDKRVTVRMTQETFDKFESYCKNQHVTTSEAIRRAVELLK